MAQEINQAEIKRYLSDSRNFFEYEEAVEYVRIYIDSVTDTDEWLGNAYGLKKYLLEDCEAEIRVVIGGSYIKFYLAVITAVYELKEEGALSTEEDLEYEYAGMLF